MQFNPSAFNIEQTRQQLNLSRSMIYKLIRDGKLESFRVGARRLVSPRAIQKFIDTAEKEAL